MKQEREDIKEKINAMELTIKRLQEEMEKVQASESLYRNLIENMNDVVYTTDEKGFVTYISPAIELMGGYSQSEILGRSHVDLVYDEDIPIRIDEFAKALSGLKSQSRFRFISKSGELKWVLSSVTPVISGVTVSGVQGVLTDITKLIKVQEALEESRREYAELSITDRLTNLYNSRHFYDQLQKEMERCVRYGRSVSLLVMDIDDFKRYNDTYGHLEGDKVLARIGSIIKMSLRKADSAYRYGGEEFVAILPETDSVQAAILAERILERIRSEKFSPFEGETLQITISIGVTETASNEEMRMFINRADMCMYEAKRLGKNQVYVSCIFGKENRANS